MDNFIYHFVMYIIIVFIFTLVCSIYNHYNICIAVEQRIFNYNRILSSDEILKIK